LAVAGAGVFAAQLLGEQDPKIKQQLDGGWGREKQIAQSVRRDQ